MDPIFSAVFFMTIVVLIVGFVHLFNKLRPAEDENGGHRGPRQAQPANRRAQLARQRGVRLRANAAANENAPDNEDPENPDANIELPDGKIGAKKRAKLEAKAEKKAQREADEKIRSERKKREQQADEERKKLEEKEKAEERQKEEEAKRIREEKERREHEEYLRMKEAFSVVDQGFEEAEEEGQNLLQDFVNYVKTNKVVIIEDLAARFKLKTQAAIGRIKDLQNDNILSGVIDDRGKFIYVSEEEMQAVAKFIRQRGRVSIAELAENSNKLVNLTAAVAN